MLTSRARPLVDIYLDLLSRATKATGLTAADPLYRCADAVLLGIGRMTKRPPIPSLGLFVPDDVVGWKLRPNADTMHCGFNMRARYTTTAEGFRRVPLCEGSRVTAPPLYFLGCSMTFGWCVSDDATFAALLARERPLENWAVPGYAPTHAYLQLMRLGLLERAKPGGTIVFCWYPFHLFRVWRRRYWLAFLEVLVSGLGAYRGNPIFEFEDEQLVYRGLALLRDAVADDRDSLVPAMEWRITEEIFLAMSKAASDKGVRFVVALMETMDDSPAEYVMPDGKGDYVAAGDRLRRRLDYLGVACIDIRAPAGQRAPRGNIPYQGYPTTLAHRIFAQRITTALG